ncbi:DOMON domain-containing protein [Tautonia rosea]|uniref:hypothetical protein n=1 Tax=Tautonia rosea TaxID=2728037 RepID=UPI00147551E7|nr:hypothetical protein [Tautonia rosea]
MSTSTAPLIPQAFYFRVALPCPKVEGIPRSGKARLLDLDRSCLLPELGAIDGRASWAEVRVAWNVEGLGISVEVTGKFGPLTHVPERPEDSDGVQLWIDTRDTRDIHRASRHCHRFHLGVVPGKGKGLEVEVRQLRIPRATVDAPLADLKPVRSTAQRIRSGYRLDVFLPGSVLNGFDAETNRRLGFSYRVTDPDRGDQFLTVGREFPVGEDPSLWATLELIE